MDASEWQRVIWTGVGGVLAVAVPDEVRVVVGSHAGIGVFNATTGERILRVRDNDYTWFEQEALAILVPIDGGGVETIPSMGLEGGFLPNITSDGWRCERTSEGAVLHRGVERVPVADNEEFRALGFSPGGSVFVLATSPNLTVLRRTQ
jgi:hypothetical protein